MTQFYEEPIVLFALLAWVLSELIGSGIIPHLRRKGKVKARRDRGSGIVVRLGAFVSVWLCFYFAMNNIAILPNWLFYVGIIMMLTGIALRQWSIWILGGFFSTSVRIVSNQRIVKEGPYTLLRHPSYTGLLMILLGLGLATRTWLGMVGTLLLFGSALGYRINVEENVLKKEFGKEYVEYSKKTKRLIPFLY